MKIDVTTIEDEELFIAVWVEPHDDEGPIDDWHPDAIDQNERARRKEVEYDDTY